MKRKRSESAIPDDKKRKKRVPASRNSVDEITRLELELDRASDLLDEVMSAAAGSDVSSKKRRRKRVVPVDDLDAEEIEQELVRFLFLKDFKIPAKISSRKLPLKNWVKPGSATGKVASSGLSLSKQEVVVF